MIQCRDKVCSRFTFENLLKGQHRQLGFCTNRIEASQRLLPVLLQTFRKRFFPHAAADTVFDDIVFEIRQLLRRQIAASRFERAQHSIGAIFFDHHADLRGDIAHDRALQDIPAGIRDQIDPVFAEDPPQNRSALLLIVADELNFVVMIAQIPHQMQNINRCALGLVVQIRRGHQMQSLASTKAFSRFCRQCIKLLLDTDHGRRAVRQAVSFRYRLPFAADAARLCSLLQPVHDDLRQRKQLAVPAVSLPVCRQHHLYLARAAHQFPDDGHCFWCEAVKAVDPYVIVPNQLRLRDLCQKQVDIILGVGVFARDPAFIFLIQQGQICQLFGRVRPLRQFAGNHCKLRTAAVKLLEL